jgi:hypothetical protein
MGNRISLSSNKDLDQVRVDLVVAADVAVDRENPADSANPVDLEDPVGLVDAVDLEDPADPEDPEDPEDPVDLADLSGRTTENIQLCLSTFFKAENPEQRAVWENYVLFVP